MFELVSWIVFGLIVGGLARLVLIGSDPTGWFATLLLGVAGSILGGFISNLMFGTAHGAFQPAGFFFSLLGAILLFLIVRKFRRTTTV
jgi:uncharacterized membrane protein YeaQ/YmgE (transglycosylase-associated protein family)